MNIKLFIILSDNRYFQTGLQRYCWCMKQKENIVMLCLKNCYIAFSENKPCTSFSFSQYFIIISISNEIDLFALFNN